MRLLERIDQNIYSNVDTWRKDERRVTKDEEGIDPKGDEAEGVTEYVEKLSSNLKENEKESKGKKRVKSVFMLGKGNGVDDDALWMRKSLSSQEQIWKVSVDVSEMLCEWD